MSRLKAIFINFALKKFAHIISAKKISYDFSRGFFMKFLKVFLLAILIFTFSLPLYACNNQTDYFSYVSELRKDIFTAENENLSVAIYSGAKETPAIFDGVKNDTGLLLGVKVIFIEEPSSAVSVTVCYDDKSYEIPLEFHPVKRALAGKTSVANLPEKQVEVTVTYGETSVNLTAVSRLNQNTISYTKALAVATKEAQTFIKENTVSGVLQAEIVIRLLLENDKNYYYVGFVTQEGLKLAYLIDGESGEILARKQN